MGGEEKLRGRAEGLGRECEEGNTGNRRGRGQVESSGGNRQPLCSSTHWPGATNTAVAEPKLAAGKVGLGCGGWRRERGQK